MNDKVLTEDEKSALIEGVKSPDTPNLSCTEADLAPDGLGSYSGSRADRRMSATLELTGSNALLALVALDLLIIGWPPSAISRACLARAEG